jgi:DNA segregation ATPase FtsK/SpoIIIE, S-DNA-T family
MPKQEKSALSRELVGIVCLSVSILLACALYSYAWTDIRSLNDPPTDKNWIGKGGAYLVYSLYSIIGGSANLLPLVILSFGLFALFRPNYRLGSGALWSLGFILSMACFIPVINHSDPSSTYRFGTGGLLGHLIGTKLLQEYLRHGAIFILGTLALVSLFMATQLQPKEVYLWALEFWQQRKAEKRERALQSGDIKTILKTREEEIAERQRLIERELARRNKRLKSTQEESRPAEAISDAAAVTPTPKREKEREPVVDPKGNEDLPLLAKPDAKPEPSAFAEKPARTSKPKPTRPAPQPTATGPYFLPPADLLKMTAREAIRDSKEEIANRGALIETTLKDFGIEIQMGEITQGATITRYEVIPSPGVKVERIVNLANNLSLALKAERVNILAPVAGKGTVGIEVANTTKAPVLIRELIESSEFRNSGAKIPLALGKDVYGKTLIADLAEMPHLLIAGSTGSGKSVCINSILTSILYKFTPEEMRLILIDPKVVELQIYNTLPHLVVPVVSDPKKVIVALRWVIREMEKRYSIMAKAGVRNIHAFNQRAKQKKAPAKEEAPKEPSEEDDQPLLIPEDKIEIPDRLPFIVVFIDELADLMLTAPVDAEDAITRITQMARAAGIHLIVATQTPRADIVTGTIKTNLPSKIAFRVASKIDSRVILDENGAENLLGKGDMIYKSSDSSVLRRAQGAFISDDEVRIIVDQCAKQAGASYDTEIHEKLAQPISAMQEASDEDQELVEQCIQVIRQEGRASTSLLQRRLRLGYTRAARIMDMLEQNGVVGPSQGAKDREILIRLDGAPPEN